MPNTNMKVFTNLKTNIIEKRSPLTVISYFKYFSIKRFLLFIFQQLIASWTYDCIFLYKTYLSSPLGLRAAVSQFFYNFFKSKRKCFLPYSLIYSLSLLKFYRFMKLSTTSKHNFSKTFIRFLSVNHWHLHCYR